MHLATAYSMRGCSLCWDTQWCHEGPVSCKYAIRTCIDRYCSYLLKVSMAMQHSIMIMRGLRIARGDS